MIQSVVPSAQGRDISEELLGVRAPGEASWRRRAL
jgi:hypothetical protein